MGAFYALTNYVGNHPDGTLRVVVLVAVPVAGFRIGTGSFQRQNGKLWPLILVCLLPLVLWAVGL